MSNSPHSFAARLKSLREERRLSKSALGKIIGVTTTCVWNWEEGNTEPRAGNMLLLSKALNVPVNYLEFGESRVESDDTPPVTPRSNLTEVIALAKMEIAHLAGIDSSKVKISLDY